MTNENAGDADLKLNKNSYLSIGIVVLIIVATVWIVTASNSIRSDFNHYQEIQKLRDEVLSTKMDGLTELYKGAALDRFTGHDHKIFVERLQELNPTLKVPHPQ